MKIKFYKYCYIQDKDILSVNIGYFYSGSGLYIEAFKADIAGMLKVYNVGIDILHYVKISHEEYELGIGKPFRLS